MNRDVSESLRQAEESMEQYQEQIHNLDMEEHLDKREALAGQAMFLVLTALVHAVSDVADKLDDLVRKG